MFVRIATFEGVDIAAAEATTEQVREVVKPLFENMDGWKGYLDLAVRSSGKMLTLAFFETDQAMQAAEPVFEEEMPRVIGPEIMQGFTGRRTSVDRYEVIDQERIEL